MRDARVRWCEGEDDAATVAHIGFVKPRRSKDDERVRWRRWRRQEGGGDRRGRVLHAQVRGHESVTRILESHKPNRTGKKQYF